MVKKLLIGLMVLFYGLGISISFYFQKEFLIAFEFSTLIAILVTLFFEFGKIFLEIIILRYPLIWRTLGIICIIGIIIANIFSLWMFRAWKTEGELIRWEAQVSQTQIRDANISSSKEFTQSQLAFYNDQVKTVDLKIKSNEDTIKGLDLQVPAQRRLVDRLQQDSTAILESKQTYLTKINELNDKIQQTLVETENAAPLDVPIVAVVSENLAVDAKTSLSILALALSLLLEILIWLISITIGSMVFGRPRIKIFNDKPVEKVVPVQPVELASEIKLTELKENEKIIVENKKILAEHENVTAVTTRPDTKEYTVVDVPAKPLPEPSVQPFVQIVETPTLVDETVALPDVVPAPVVEAVPMPIEIVRSVPTSRNVVDEEIQKSQIVVSGQVRSLIAVLKETEHIKKPEVFRRIRQLLHFTQQEMGERLKVTQVDISRLESGKAFISDQMVLKLEDWFNGTHQ